MKKLLIGLCAFILAFIGTLSNVGAHGDEAVTIQFAARVGNRAVDCGITFAGLGATKTNAQISDFRFFISNLRLIDANGKEVPVKLDQDGAWQYESTALLNFVNGKGCGESAMEQQNHTVVGMVAEGTYVGLAYDLGVPFELNHLNNVSVPSPLNVAAMFWSWQSGWKFVRVDMITGQEKLEPWVIHLGSTGCESAADTTPPEKECAQPNRVTVQFDKFDASINMIVADLATLVAEADLDHHKAMPPGCMSGPDDPDCSKLIPTGFGLDLATGIPTGVNAQKFFRVE